MFFDKQNKEIMKEKIIKPYYDVYVHDRITELLENVKQYGDQVQIETVNKLFFEVHTLTKADYSTLNNNFCASLKSGKELKDFFDEYFKIMNGQLDEHHMLMQYLTKWDNTLLISELNKLIIECFQEKSKQQQHELLVEDRPYRPFK